MSKASDFDQIAQNGGWLDAYLDLRAHGLHWRKAAFSAWEAAPKGARKPKTMRELAYLLNYKSEQVFYKWRQQDWYQQLGVERVRENIFTRHLADVDQATIRAAIEETGSPGVQARRLFYEQAGRGPVTPPDYETDQQTDREFERALLKAYDDSDDETD